MGAENALKVAILLPINNGKNLQDGSLSHSFVYPDIYVLMGRFRIFAMLFS